MTEDLYIVIHCPGCNFITRLDKKQTENAPGWNCPNCGMKNKLRR